jgi:hypothetical protein
MKRFFLPLFSTPAVRRLLAAFVFAGTFHPGLHTAHGEPAPGVTKDKAAVGLDALEVVKVVERHYRLVMKSYDSPESAQRPSDVTVAINLRDVNRTQFIAVGEDIRGTNLSVKSFKQMVAAGADISEAIILDKRTGAEVKLPLKQEVDIPETTVVFRYQWSAPGQPKTSDFVKRSGESFALPPDHDTKYKVVEIKPERVVLELPDGTRKTLKLTP